MLFDPFKKQFDLPTTFVELRDHERRQHKVVRQKHKPFAGFDVEVMNSSQRFGIRLRRFDARQHNRLVAAKTGRLVDDPRLPTLGIEVLFGACQEECGLLVQPVQTRIVDVRLVHDVERARFDRQFVQDVYVVHFSVRNAKKTGDIAAQIEQRVKLDGSLPASKRGPGKQRETQIDGRRIESIDRPFQIDFERLVAIKFSRAG